MAYEDHYLKKVTRIVTLAAASKRVFAHSDGNIVPD